uniref:NADH-ubiquinone oxidoreductase chain 6 n=1 Tax=Copelatus sp. COP02 TaxID=1205547 RepID=A0A0S2MPM0_9DYTI|nr:NADH deshydrogenase subunit 6 [Copelatus sp. COP02]
MYFILMSINIIMTMTFMFLNHPMSMGLILMIQTVTISLMTGMFFLFIWFSYIYFLIMVGGMLILFIYMTSLASNEMLTFQKNIMILIMISILFSMTIYYMIDYMMINSLFKTSNLIEMYNNMMLYKNENLKTLNMIYNNPNMMITTMLINYLFLTLIAVVKITNLNYGPLRQKF